jgi:alpha-L-fucosidase
MKPRLLFYLTFLNLNIFAQVNFVKIDSTESESYIIRKAANVIPSIRQLKWQQQELTAFFHFGINTFTNKEWGDGKEDLNLFNPINFNAKQWVTVVKKAGFKQVILTAKHHDGFCLWPSKYTDHSVKNSPFKNGKGDVVKELSNACTKNKIGFGVYLSPWDHNNKLYGTDAYNDFFANQLTELLTQYGTINEVWFDGANGEGPNGKKQVYDFERWYKIIRKLQPNAVIAIMGPDVRWVGTETGYGRETEWSVVPINNLNALENANNQQQHIAFPPQGDLMQSDLGSRAKLKQAKGLAWYPAEVDVSIRPGWFYHEAENKEVKTAAKLMDIYCNSVGKNGLLLLNIPPDINGLINAADSSALMQFKMQRDNIFKKQLIKKTIIDSNEKLNANVLIDENFATSFLTSFNTNKIVLELEVKENEKVNLIQLQEDITKGQRIEEFILEAFVNNKWKLVAKGTTIGYKRIINFDTIVAQKFRLSIVQSRLNPILAEVGLYYWEL